MAQVDHPNSGESTVGTRAAQSRPWFLQPSWQTWGLTVCHFSIYKHYANKRGFYRETT